MKDVAPAIEQWLAEGRPMAMATVINTWGSSPRSVGANMVVDGQGNLAGSVSGGCVEGAVVEISQKVLGGGPAEKVHFGVSDETAWEVGLACGGEIDVFVEPLASKHFEFINQAIEQELPAATLTVIGGSPEWLGMKISASGNRGEMALADWEDAVDRRRGRRGDLGIADHPGDRCWPTGVE